jgi:hypothetical protein
MFWLQTSHYQAAYKKVWLGFRYCTKGHIWNQLDPLYIFLQVRALLRIPLFWDMILYHSTAPTCFDVCTSSESLLFVSCWAVLKIRRADNRITFMCRLSWNPRTSTSWNPTWCDCFALLNARSLRDYHCSFSTHLLTMFLTHGSLEGLVVTALCHTLIYEYMPVHGLKNLWGLCLY